jgi:soluble lytic murein transglycosylase
MARATAAAERNPLAMWVDYWELTNRLNEAQRNELNAFWARWAGTYVEDRLRNDWLLELGRAATGPISPSSTRVFA